MKKMIHIFLSFTLMFFIVVLAAPSVFAADQNKQNAADADEDIWVNETSAENDWSSLEKLDSTGTSVSETETPAASNSKMGGSTASVGMNSSSITYQGSSEVALLIQGGQLVQAREKLMNLLSAAADKTTKDGIENDLSVVNLELLKSKEVSPGTSIYQVKSGDSLYVIARKNGTSVNMIKLINGLDSDTIFPGQKLKVLKGDFSITVDKSDNVLKLFLGDQFFKRYNVATGASADLTPTGTFTIVNKLENPTWYKTGAKPIASGDPDNQLGTRWLGFSKSGFGIHGTIHPESIGHHATSGCVRMLNADVEELYNLVPAGAKVTIIE